MLNVHDDTTEHQHFTHIIIGLYKNSIFKWNVVGFKTGFQIYFDHQIDMFWLLLHSLEYRGLC